MLDNVSLTVEQGAFVMLLGLNGAGKSTLFSLITRLYDNVSGQISIRGFDVRRRPSQALQRLGVVFQSRTLDIDLSLMQNLKYHAALHGFSSSEATSGPVRRSNSSASPIAATRRFARFRAVSCDASKSLAR